MSGKKQLHDCGRWWERKDRDKDLQYFAYQQRLARKSEEKAAALVQGALNLNRAV